MKRPIILVFPMAAGLLFYASAIPLQQSRGIGVVGRSLPSYPFAIDCALTQPSHSSDRHSTNIVVQGPNSDTQSQGTPSTQPPAQGIVNPSHLIKLPPISTLLNGPDHFIHPFQPTGHSVANVNLDGHHIRPTLLPSAQSTPLSGCIHVQLVNGGAPYGEDMLPFPISEDWSSLSSQNLAATLRARAMTSTSREEQAIVNMWIMNVVFEKKLKELDWAASVDLLKPWLKEMQNFALEEGVWNSALVQTWTTKLTTQMEAMASLQQGKVQQAIWDGYWIDDDHLHTTRLKGGPIDIPHKHQAGKVLYINKKDLPPGKSEQLESANLFSTLLNIADSSLSSKRGTINGLFLLRKGIQMWMKSGMKKDEFDQREKKLREIVMNRTPANQLRAEMVFISLRRFMKDQKIQLIG